MKRVLLATALAAVGLSATPALAGPPVPQPCQYGGCVGTQVNDDGSVCVYYYAEFGRVTIACTPPTA